MITHDVPRDIWFKFDWPTFREILWNLISEEYVISFYDSKTLNDECIIKRGFIKMIGYMFLEHFYNLLWKYNLDFAIFYNA